MNNLHMIPWEMAELLQLLTEYDNIYHSSCNNIDELKTEIRERLSVIPDNRCTETNPRGAGRHTKITSVQVNKVNELHDQGKSIRRISEETGLSVGSVQKLINEHHKKSVNKESSGYTKK